MEILNNDFLGKHKKFRTDSKKLATIFLVSAFIVAIIVFWWLKLVGITVTGEAFCGLDEHTHSSACYVSELICDYAEETTNAESEEETEEEPGEESGEEALSEEEETESSDEDITEETHTHSAECCVTTLVCTAVEHIHTEECYPDKTADMETVSDWIATLSGVEITNDIPENLVKIANSQMGYEESNNNFEYDSEGNKNGYTRYGEWYGNPYGKWNTMFVAFCLHYSNINNDAELKCAGAEAMRHAWQQRGVYKDEGEHTPERGDLVFVDTDGDGKADTVGIIVFTGKDVLQVVMGDSNNKVENVFLDIDDSIIGYGLTGELYFAKDMEYEEESSEPIIVESERTEEDNYPILMMSDLSEQSDVTEPEITYINDLTSVVKSVSIKTLDGEVIGPDSLVYIGQTYIISMEFAEKNTGSEWIQFRHDEDHHLHYRIPDNIKFVPIPEEEAQPITAKTENGTIEDVGKYYLTEDGLLVVIFEDDETGLCFGAKYSNVDFNIEFQATVGSNGSDKETEIKFNDEIRVNLNLDTKAEMDVTKTQSEHNPKTNTIDYTVTIKGTKGAISDLIVYDDMYTDNNQHALTDTIVVTDLDGNVLNPQPTIAPGRGNNNLGFTLTGFPDFSAGEGYIITYQTALNDDILDQESVGVWNGVYPEGKSPNGEKVTGKATAGGEIPLSKIKKDGAQKIIVGSDGNAKEVIEWIVEIRKNDVNLNGTVLIDILGDGLEYYKGKDIIVHRYDQSGKNHLGETTISWDNDNVKIEGNQMSFPLPDGYTYQIVYYTTYGKLGEDNQANFTNKAIVEIEGEKESTNGNVNVVGYVPNVRKSVSDTDGEYVYFTIESDIPAVIKDWGGFFLTDYAYFWGNNFGTYNVDNKPEDLIITAKTETGQEINFTPYVEGGNIENTYIYSPASGEQYHSFYIFFNTSTPDAASSKWILDEDAKLTIKYKLSFDSKLGSNWTGEPNIDKTVEDMLLEENALSNDAYLNFTSITSAWDSASFTYSPNITKKSSVKNDGTVDYTVTFYNTIPNSGGNQGYLTSAYSIIFNDTFDEKLEYVKDSLMVTCYNPWDNSVWYNKYAYDGEVSGNTMSIPASNLKLIQTNPDLPSETIGWISPFTDYQKYCNRIGAGGKHVFTYKLKLKDTYLNSTEENKYVLDNTAELKWSGDNSSGPATETSEIKTGLLDKQVVQEDNKLLFDIHVNKNALDILKGADTITIEDTMTHNLSVYWDTIKILYEDKQTGKWIDFDSPESSYKYTVTYDQTSNKLTFILPDSLHMRIDYTTLITESGYVSVNNAVKVDGKASVTDIIEATFHVQDHSGEATGSMHEITLLKQDGATDLRLSDVTFLLYGPMGDPSATPPASAGRYITTDNGEKLYFIGSYTTGEDGTVKIKTQYLTLGGPYALVETAAPEGYTPLEKPVYFYFYDTDPNGIIQTVTTLIAVENYTYGFVLPETGGTGTLPLTIIGVALMAVPILYSTIRRKRERRLT